MSGSGPVQGSGNNIFTKFNELFKPKKFQSTQEILRQELFKGIKPNNFGNVIEQDKNNLGYDEDFAKMFEERNPISAGGSNNTKVEKLEKEVTNTDNQVNDTQGNVTTQEKSVQDLQSGMENTKNTISSLEGQINNLQKPDESNFKNEDGEVDDAAYQEAMSEYENKLNELNKQIEDAKNELENLTSQHQEADSQLGELKSQLETLQGELDSKKNELNQAKQQNMESNKTDSVTYKNDGQTTANDVFHNKGISPINNREQSDKVMNDAGLDVSKLKPENIKADENGITYTIDGKYYRVAADELGNANIIRSEVDGDNVKTELFKTNSKADKYGTNGNGELNAAQRKDLAADMMRSGTTPKGLRSTGNAAFDKLGYTEKVAVMNEYNKMNEEANSNVPSRDGIGVGKTPGQAANTGEVTGKNQSPSKTPEETENKPKLMSLDDAKKLGFNGSQEDLDALINEFATKLNDPDMQNTSFVDFVKEDIQANDISNKLNDGQSVNVTNVSDRVQSRALSKFGEMKKASGTNPTPDENGKTTPSTQTPIDTKQTPNKGQLHTTNTGYEEGYNQFDKNTLNQLSNAKNSGDFLKIAGTSGTRAGYAQFNAEVQKNTGIKDESKLKTVSEMQRSLVEKAEKNGTEVKVLDKDTLKALQSEIKTIQENSQYSKIDINTLVRRVCSDSNSNVSDTLKQLAQTRNSESNLHDFKGLMEMKLDD